EVAGIFPSHALVGGLRDLRFPQPEPFGQGNAVRWLFIAITFGVSRRASHCELSRWYPHITKPVLGISLGVARLGIGILESLHAARQSCGEQDRGQRQKS